MSGIATENASQGATAKARFLAVLQQLQPEPTAIVDSGNGIQVLFKLAVPIVLAGSNNTGSAAPSTGAKSPGTRAG
jgi:hypothetical protein